MTKDLEPEKGQSTLVDHGFPGVQIKRNRFPLQANCFSCGKLRWLSWSLEESQVCDECKHYLLGEKK